MAGDLARGTHCKQLPEPLPRALHDLGEGVDEMALDRCCIDKGQGRSLWSGGA